jgi:hypothetical protein
VFLPPNIYSSLSRSNMSPIIFSLSELLLYINFTFLFILHSRKRFIIYKRAKLLNRNTTFTFQQCACAKKNQQCENRIRCFSLLFWLLISAWTT